MEYHVQKILATFSIGRCVAQGPPAWAAGLVARRITGGPPSGPRPGQWGSKRILKALVVNGIITQYTIKRSNESKSIQSWDFYVG